MLHPSRSCTALKASSKSNVSICAVDRKRSVCQGTLDPQGVVQGEVQVQQLQLRPTVQAFAPDLAVPDGRLDLALTLAGTRQQLQGKAGSLSLPYSGRSGSSATFRPPSGSAVRLYRQTCTGRSRGTHSSRCAAQCGGYRPCARRAGPGVHGQLGHARASQSSRAAERWPAHARPARDWHTATAASARRTAPARRSTTTGRHR